MTTTNPKQLRAKLADPRAESVRLHGELAAKAFSKHVLREDLSQGVFRSWLCRNPDDSSYWFRVSTGPGWIMVTGDIGTLVVERCEDMVSWSRSAVNSIDYFAEKVPREIPTEQYCADVARYWIADQIAECNRMVSDGYEEYAERKKKLLELDSPDAPCDEQPRFELALYESGLEDGSDWPNFRNYTSSFLWCREAVKWLLAHLPEETKHGG